MVDLPFVVMMYWTGNPTVMGDPSPPISPYRCHQIVEEYRKAQIPINVWCETKERRTIFQYMPTCLLWEYDRGFCKFERDDPLWSDKTDPSGVKK